MYVHYDSIFINVAYCRSELLLVGSMGILKCLLNILLTFTDKTEFSDTTTGCSTCPKIVSAQFLMCLKGPTIFMQTIFNHQPLTLLLK